MGRSPIYFEEDGLKRGPWTQEEDEKLLDFINQNGRGSWRSLPKLAGLNRCGKSCRLRWTNYLRPDIKRGKFSDEEERQIIHLHSLIGNKWSRIAAQLPGRTDNEIKNFWNTHLRRKLLHMGIDPMTHMPRTDYNHLLMNLTQLLISIPNQSMKSNNSSSWDSLNALKLQAEVKAELAKAQLVQNLIHATNITSTQSTTPFGTSHDYTISLQGLVHSNSGSYDTNNFVNPSETSLSHQASVEFQGAANSWTASFEAGGFGTENCGWITNNNPYNYQVDNDRKCSLPALVSVDCQRVTSQTETKKDQNLSSSYMLSSISPTGSSFQYSRAELLDDDLSFLKDFLEI